MTDRERVQVEVSPEQREAFSVHVASFEPGAEIVAEADPFVKVAEPFSGEPVEVFTAQTSREFAGALFDDARIGGDAFHRVACSIVQSRDFYVPVRDPSGKFTIASYRRQQVPRIMESAKHIGLTEEDWKFWRALARRAVVKR